MNKKSLNWGIGITVVWLAVIVVFWIFGGLTSPSSLNELGDFLAGAFAPIAFLWLILGYIQQGKQLDQNTKALEQQERALQLQIEEMRESVLQQTRLASIQDDQLEMMRKEKRPFLTINQARLNTQPNKFSTLDHQLNGDSKPVIKFLLRNEGRGSAKFIKLIINNSNLKVELPKLDEGKQETVFFSLDEDELNTLINSTQTYLFLIIKFMDIYDCEFKAFYDLTIELNNSKSDFVNIKILSYQNQYNSSVAQ